MLFVYFHLFHVFSSLVILYYSEGTVLEYCLNIAKAPKCFDLNIAQVVKIYTEHATPVRQLCTFPPPQNSSLCAG